MSIREFTDSRGVHWQVWSTIPSHAIALEPELRDGWLSFDSGMERRRVCPIPKAWDQMPDERLELLCRVATTARVTDPKGVAIIADEASEEPADS